VFFFQACEKDSFLEDADVSQSDINTIGKRSRTSNESHIFNRSDDNPVYEGQTILGEEINNPFSISNISQAHSNLYQNEDASYIHATDRYVKFTPTDIEEVKTLYNSDVELWDYPLHFHIVEEGEYYQELGENEMPTLYAVIPVEDAIPSVNYEVLDEYYFDDSNPILLAESFSITGNEEYMEDFTGIPLSFYQSNRVNHRIPTCPEECKLVAFLDDSVAPAVIAFFCDCPSDNPPIAIPRNECGCPVFVNDQKPAGCIKVEDTQYSTSGDVTTFLPVRRVKVVGRNLFSNIFTTFADDNGCWKVNQIFNGPIWVKIKFEHDRAKFRGKQRGFSINPFALLETIRDRLGVMTGKDFNDIEVNYHLWDNAGSLPHMYWGASTVNNALHEFHDYATADNINTPPLDLDFYLGWKQGFGYATMTNFIGNFPLTNAVTSGFMNSNSAMVVPFVANLPLSYPLVLVVSNFLPDVFVGLAGNFSDDLKRLSYHEIAHASHYDLVGNSFWSTLITATILADFNDGRPHGISTSVNAGHLAVAESWAQFIELLYSHRTYPTNLLTSIFTTYGRILETTHNEVAMHIPIGLYNDLIDARAPNRMEPFCSFLLTDRTLATCVMVADDVTGFSISELFSLLGPGTTNMAIFKTSLESSLLQGSNNTQQQIDNLFADYGL